MSSQQINGKAHAILSEKEKDNGNRPSVIGRILFFLIPVALCMVTQEMYGKRVAEVTLQYDILAMGETWAVEIMKLTSFIAIFIAGIRAIIDNAWSTKAWILFAVGIFFIAIWNPIYQEGSLFALNITAGFTVISSLAFEWMWIELDKMPKGTWKHISKNLIGYFLATVIIACLADVGQVSIHSCGMGYRVQAILFWISTPIIFISLIYYNSTRYPPFVDSIGLILGAIVALLNSLTSTLNYVEKERMFELYLKQIDEMISLEL